MSISVTAEPAAKKKPAWWMIVLNVIFFAPKVVFRWFDEAFLSYIRMRVIYLEKDRPSSMRFVSYTKWIFAHPLVWGALLLEVLARTGALHTKWGLFLWFMLIVIVWYAVNDKMSWQKLAIVGVVVALLLTLNALGNLQYGWNPVARVKNHIIAQHADVTPGFFRVSAYVFLAMMSGSVVWSWLMSRVEQGRDYIVCVRFLSRTGREPTFAAPIERDHSDLAEVVLANSANLTIRTRTLGTLYLPNVPMMAYGPKAQAMDELCRPRTHEETVAEQKGQTVEPDVMPAQHQHHRNDEHDGQDGHDHDGADGHDHDHAHDAHVSDDIRAPG